MAVKRGQAPKKIAATLAFNGVAEKFKLNVTYNNIGNKVLREAGENEGSTIADLVLLLVDEWDADYPLSLEGINDFDDERPGVADGLLSGYLRSRRVELEKN